LRQFETNVDELQANAGGDTVELIVFLMKRCENAYRSGVTFSNEIDNPIALPESLGLCRRRRRSWLASSIRKMPAGLQLELKMLVLMWPCRRADLRRPVPAPPSTFLSQLSRIGLELSTFE
jgi:hypothetical protein